MSTLSPALILFVARRLLGGFLFIPTVLAVLGVILAVLAVWADRTSVIATLFEGNFILQISAQGARAVLSTIAGAIMTVISLVYSLTLVVFTLAAGNISPRLLELFTKNRVNQFTIGLLGATFLYSLIVLYIIGDEEVPKLSVAMGIFLAAASFFWLVYFVHNVAGQVRIDNEIGRSQRVLLELIDKTFGTEIAEVPVDTSAQTASKPVDVSSQQNGYVASIDTAHLVKIAQERDGFIELHAKPGDFLLDGLPVASLYSFPDFDEETMAHAVRNSIVISRSRTADDDIQFTLNLLVEIALRALSPGVNDAYTAISAIDHLSAGLARILRRAEPPPVLSDNEGRPRMRVSVLSTKDIIGTTVHPLRQAVQGNVFVTIRLLWALERIAQVCDPGHRGLIARHVRLIAEDCKYAVADSADRREIAENIRRVRNALRRN